MPDVTQLPQVFLGSSSEGLDVARHFQVAIGTDLCEVTPWNDINVFKPSGYTLESLIEVASRVDFAVLVAAPDDTTVSRGVEMASARDNIVLEFGLFAGALDRSRTLLLATGDLKLPTDILGLTRLAYQPQTNMTAAITAAALKVRERVAVWVATPAKSPHSAVRRRPGPSGRT